MIRGKYGVKIAENVVGKRSDESWKNVVGFPRLQSSLWRLLIARQRRLQETSGWPHALQNPLMYTYMLQTPLLCAPSDYLYTADFQNVRAHGGEQTP